jgi:hypothetical protein
MGRYARIKAQTNVVISWLVETASAHGKYTYPSCELMGFQAPEHFNTYIL